MPVYINVKDNGEVETIDEFETRKEARETLREYQIASTYFSGAYLSSRCTREWARE